MKVLKVLGRTEEEGLMDFIVVILMLTDCGMLAGTRGAAVEFWQDSVFD